MLFIFKWFGLGACIIFSIRAIAEKWLYDGPKEEVRYFTKIAVVCGVVFLVCFIGLETINSLYFEETVQTGEYKSIYIENDRIHYINFQNVQRKMDINDDCVRVIEEKDCVPHMIEYKVYTKNKMSDNWRLLLTMDAFDPVEIRYEVYVPEGYLKDAQ